MGWKGRRKAVRTHAHGYTHIYRETGTQIETGCPPLSLSVCLPLSMCVCVSLCMCLYVCVRERFYVSQGRCVIGPLCHGHCTVCVSQGRSVTALKASFIGLLLQYWLILKTRNFFFFFFSFFFFVFISSSFYRLYWWIS